MVIRDTDAGIISTERARTVYGVSASESDDETRGRRDKLYKERLIRAAQPVKTSTLEVRSDSRTLTTFGSGLQIVAGADEELLLVCKCGQSFCRATENWKDYAMTSRLDEEELPGGIRTHESIELVEYLCPNCGTRHALDIKEKDIQSFHDLKIHSMVRA